ncbi:MAG TPA: hypothetical protein VHM69_12285 [Rubrobacter sp.]|nr:hypothetical protein [Rubrobacter sp.]
MGSGIVGPAVAVDIGQPSRGNNVVGMVEEGRRVPVNCDHDEVAAGRGVAECPAKCRRTVKLTRDAAEALRVHPTRQLEDIDGMGDYYRGLVFATMKGTLLNPTNLRKRSFAQLLVRADLPNQIFHQLRHTAAAILLHKNVNPKIVSEM